MWEEDVIGMLETKDGKVYLRRSILETFEIARKMIDICEKRLQKCPIQGVSKDCKKCDGLSTIWEEDGKIIECVYVMVWKARKKGFSTPSAPYKPLMTNGGTSSHE